MSWYIICVNPPLVVIQGIHDLLQEIVSIVSHDSSVIINSFVNLCSAVERTSKYEPSETAVDEDVADVYTLDETDYTPHYQRVFISGEETSNVSF